MLCGYAKIGCEDGTFSKRQSLERFPCSRTTKGKDRSVYIKSDPCSLLDAFRISLLPTIQRSRQCQRPNKRRLHLLLPLHRSLNQSTGMRHPRHRLRRAKYASTSVRGDPPLSTSFFSSFAIRKRVDVRNLIRHAISSPRCRRRGRLRYRLFRGAPSQRTQSRHQEDRAVRSLHVLSPHVARTETSQVSERGRRERERVYIISRGVWGD